MVRGFEKTDKTAFYGSTVGKVSVKSRSVLPTSFVDLAHPSFFLFFPRFFRQSFIPLPLFSAQSAVFLQKTAGFVQKTLAFPLPDML